MTIYAVGDIQGCLKPLLVRGLVDAELQVPDRLTVGPETAEAAG